jgi:ATP-dependent exoDNAse (exonuclease V) beta subunit
MKFIGYDIPNIERVETAEGRRYKTPDGNLYPSVTNIVGKLTESSIKEWKESVGEEVANEIGRKAATRGTLIHENCERYLKGETLTFTMFQNEERKMFRNFMPILNSIEEVHAMETQLYSDRFKYAGTVDLIAKISGKMYILDWKTTSKFKSRTDIAHYFIQASAYAFAFWERTGVAVDRIRIAMTGEEVGLLEYDEPVRNWFPGFIEARRAFG